MTKETTSRRFMRGLPGLAVVTLGIALAAPAAYAGHQWSDLHWQIPDQETEVTLAVLDCRAVNLMSVSDINLTHGDWNGVISTAASPAPLTVTPLAANCAASGSDPIGGFPHAGQSAGDEIGRASCRERV